MSQTIEKLENEASVAILNCIIANPMSPYLVESYSNLVRVIKHRQEGVIGSVCVKTISEVLPVDETPAAPETTKATRKPRTPKETPAATPEPETAEEEAQPEEPETDPNVDEAPAGKTHEEWIEQGKTLYLKKSGIAKDTSDEASRNFKANAAKLISKHGGTKVSDVPLENYEAFFAELVNLKL